ncbi:MAG: hypothetical protein AAGA83_10425 [Cyanobacteria bacterium P01_F01_bin.116]
MQSDVFYSQAVPRTRWKGQLDRLIGPGATPAELLLQFVPAVVAAISAPLYASTLPINWTSWQLGLMAVLGFDLVGGVLTNATAAAKRWYHRPGRGWRQHLMFIIMHLLHIGLVAFLFRGADGVFFAVVSSYLLLASGLILGSPLYLQRPVALGLYGLMLICDRYLISPTPGLEWFLPLFFLKLLVSHLLNETPYQPGETR